MKQAAVVIWINLVIEVFFGLIMLLVPGFFNRLVFVPEPTLFIQLVGSVALSMALLCLLSLQAFRGQPGEKVDTVANEKIALIVCSTLALFHFGLAIFLGAAAVRGLVSWLGILTHLPMALLCIYGMAMLKKTTKT